MNILDIFKSRTKGKVANIGIGLGSDLSQNLKIVRAIEDFLLKNSLTIYLFGMRDYLSQIAKELIHLKSNIKLIEDNVPEKKILKYLKKNIINAAIRGNLSSTKFLNHLKDLLYVSEINRLALLETSDKKQFFFGPVGIDECNDFHKKITFIENAIQQFKYLNIKPRISILSGGRLSDIGRDEYVDKTINIANKVVDYFQKNNHNLTIQHDEILIEKILKNKSNLVIAPDGISGNLIYRTLVHLGGGKAYGAIYMNLDYTIIDTSRAGKISEIQGALILALALGKNKP